ncbi:MAG: glycoside hydrolase family 16 protein [Chitinophagaceae bacterium]
MQNKPAIKILVLIVFACNILFAVAQKKAGWKMIWSEEFNYTGLPDAKIWSYEIGHIRNHEQQYYTNADKKNVWVNNGVLTITGRKENQINQFYKKESADWRYKDSVANYTSASITTDGKLVPIHIGRNNGRIEVKAMMPQGSGMWPAIWMMGVNRSEVGWPACGEIDVMEFIGNHPTDIYGTVHFVDTDKQLHSSGSKITDTTLSTKFHVYALEWNEQKIDFYFDDIKYHSFIIDSAGSGKGNPFRKDFYLLLNLAMGADWPGPIDDKLLPQKFVVDYVRIYERK